MKTIDISNYTRQEWLELRKKGIGGSDIANIVNMGGKRFGSPMSVYADKLGISEMKEETELMKWGHKMEPIIGQLFTQETGLSFERTNCMFVSERWDKAFANLDGIIPDKAIVEFKNVSEFNRSEWDEESGPMKYYLQCQWYMYVTQLPKAYLCGLIGGNTLSIKEIKYDPFLAGFLESSAKEFWESHVEKRIAPEPDGTDASKEVINSLFPKSEQTTLDLSEHSDLYDKYKHWSQVAKEAEKVAEKHKQDIMMLMKDAEVATLGTDLDGNVKKVSWKTQKATRLDAKALESEHPDLVAKFKKESTFRVFRG